MGQRGTGVVLRVGEGGACAWVVGSEVAFCWVRIGGVETTGSALIAGEGFQRTFHVRIGTGAVYRVLRRARTYNASFS
jgi:hypothetical protein